MKLWPARIDLDGGFFLDLSILVPSPLSGTELKLKTVLFLRTTGQILRPFSMLLYAVAVGETVTFMLVNRLIGF